MVDVRAPTCITDVLNKLGNVKPIRGGWQADCPCSGHDSPDKHLSVRDAGDKALVTCFNVHSYQDICKALGYESLTYSKNGNGASGFRTIVATYDYTDEAGELLFQTVRFQPKDFSQRRPNVPHPESSNDWTWSLKGVRRVLYNLPGVLAAIKKGDPVVFVEGEKDADNVRKIPGYEGATTSPMGAGNFKGHDYEQSLEGADLVIIADNDQPGQTHKKHVIQATTGIAKRIRTIELDPKYKDISEWFADGGTAETFEGMVQSAKDASPPRAKPAITITDTDEIQNTDLGNARRLVAKYGADIRYSFERKSWLVWKGTHWKWDSGAEVTTMAQSMSSLMLKEAADMGKDNPKRIELIAHALKSESSRAINAMMEQARALVAIDAGTLDKNPWLINLENGTLDLRDGSVKLHDKEDYLSICLPFDFIPGATAPTWESFLDVVMGGNEGMIAFLQRVAGYCLTGITKAQVFLFLYGLGANGKSTFINALCAMLGPYTAKVASDTLLNIRGRAGHHEGVANLQGKRLVVSSETEKGAQLAEGLLKDMTGQDKIRASRKHEHEVEFDPTFKIVMFGNHRPKIADTTHSIWRRVKLVPFTVTIPDDKKDEDLPDKLQLEREGIFAWCLQGCREWQRIGLAQPEEVTTATEQYRQDSDDLSDFIAVFIFEDDATITKARMSELYKAYCTEAQVDPLTQAQFKAKLEAHGITGKRGAKGTHLWVGLRERTAMDPEPGDKVTRVTGISAYFSNASRVGKNIPKIQSPVVTHAQNPESCHPKTDFPTEPCEKCGQFSWAYTPDADDVFCTNCAAHG